MRTRLRAARRPVMVACLPNPPLHGPRGIESPREDRPRGRVGLRLRGGRRERGDPRIVPGRAGERALDGGGRRVRLRGCLPVPLGLADGQGADDRPGAGDARGGPRRREGLREDEPLGGIEQRRAMLGRQVERDALGPL